MYHSFDPISEVYFSESDCHELWILDAVLGPAIANSDPNNKPF